MKVLGRNLIAIVLLLAIGCQLAPAMRPFVLVEELVHQCTETLETVNVQARRTRVPNLQRRARKSHATPSQAHPNLHTADLGRQIKTLPLSRRGPPA